MAQLKELKTLFRTGDLTSATIDFFDLHDGWTVWVFSKCGNEWIPLDAQRNKASNGECRIFKTVEAALNEVKKIGFKADSLNVKGKK